MLNRPCLAVLAAVLILPLALGLRRLWRTRTSVLAARRGASLPPTWHPPEARAVRVPEPGHPAPAGDWSRYARPACLRRAQRASAVTPPSSHKEDLPC